MSIKDWVKVIACSILVLLVVVTVMYGGQAFVVDTGRQILGK